MSENTKLTEEQLWGKLRIYYEKQFKPLAYYSTPNYMFDNIPNYPIPYDLENSEEFSTEYPPTNLNQTFNKIKSKINDIYFDIHTIIDGISVILYNCNIMKETIKDETAVMYLDEMKEVFFDLKNIFKAPDLNYNLLLLLELTKLLDENKELFIKNESSLSSSNELNNKNSEIFTSRLLDNLKELRNKVKEQNKYG